MRTKALTFFLTLIVLPCYAFGLEPLSVTQMKDATAQAGITVAMSDVALYHHVDAFRLTDPTDTANPQGYIEFQEIESVTTIDVGTSDVDDDGFIGFLTLDLFTVNNADSPINGKPLLNMQCSDMDYRKNITIGNIQFCERDLGSASINTLSMQSFQLLLGSHDCGVDLEFGTRVTVDEFSFRYGTGDVDALTLSGITFAGSFTDDMTHR